MVFSKLQNTRPSDFLISLYRKGLLLTTVTILLATATLWWLTDIPVSSSYQNSNHVPAFDSIVARELQTAQKLLFSNPDTALAISYHNLEALIAGEVPQHIIPFYNILGTVYLYQAQYDKAVASFYASLDYATRNKLPQYTAQAYQNIATVNLLTYRYKDALGLFLNAKEILDGLNDPIRSALVENSIGRVYYEINDLEKAAAYYYFAYQGFIENDFPLGISSVCNHIGKYYLAVNQLDSALIFLNKAIDYSQMLGNNYGLSSVYREKGLFYEKQKDFYMAVKYYKLSDSIANTLNFRPLNIYPKLSLADIYIYLGDFAKAENALLKAQKLVSEHDSDQIRYKFNEVYSRFYENKGNDKLAFYYHKLANEFKNKMISQAETYQVYNIEIEQLSRQMEIKEMEVQEQQLLLAKRKNTAILTIVIAVFFVVIISLFYFFYLNKLKQRDKEIQYQREMKYTFEKSLAVMEAESNERIRLASELHDGIGTQLSLTKLTLSNVLERHEISEERKNQFLHSSVKTIDDIIREVKNISNSMTPLTLMDKGFKEAIKELVASYSNIKRQSIKLNISGLNGEMNHLAEQTIFRTMQEIISNAVKHSHCEEINIQILQDHQELTLMIEDDGVGFDMLNKQFQKGMGLKNAKSRIENLDGQFLVDSNPGRGTIITMIIPLTKVHALKNA